MYINSNKIEQRNLQNVLQQEINILNSQFMSWKAIVGQFPSATSLPSHPIIPEILKRLDCINGIIHNFCQHFDREMSLLKERNQFISNLESVGVKHCESRPQTDDKKFQIVNQKISLLENDLKKTQQSEKKLEKTLNFIMSKYQDLQEKNNKSTFQDNYLSSSQSTAKANDSLINLRICGQTSSRSKPKDPSTHFGKKQERKNVYLLPEQSYSLDYSTYASANMKLKPQNQLKVFSQSDQNKRSLKNLHKPSRTNLPTEERRSYVRDSSTSRSNKHVSLDRNDHRFKFMVSNLGN